jgi:hypothetical protein
MDAKLKSRTRRLGITTPGAIRSARPTSMMRFSIVSGLSFQRKFLMLRAIFRASTRNVPSRVRPV